MATSGYIGDGQVFSNIHCSEECSAVALVADSLVVSGDISSKTQTLTEVDLDFAVQGFVMNGGGVDTAVDPIIFKNGVMGQVYNIATATAPNFTYNAGSGIDIDRDATEDDGCEINFGDQATADMLFTVGTSQPFEMEVKVSVADVSAVEPFFIGFRTQEANAADFATYAKMALIGAHDDTGADVISTATGAGVLDAGTDAWVDAQTVTLTVQVSFTGAVTFLVDGVVAVGTPAAAYSFATDDVIMPTIIYVLNADASPAAVLHTLRVGLQ